LACQNPVIQDNFEQILQFEDKIEDNLLLDNRPVPQMTKGRGKTQSKKNQPDSWKNKATSEYRPTKGFKLNCDTEATDTLTRSKLKFMW
jgi:hypothetical protein